MDTKGVNLPTEERKFKDFYPDLIPTLDLPVTILNKENKDLQHQFFMEQPLPPLKVEFTKVVPVAKYEIIDTKMHKKQALPAYAQYVAPTEDELNQRVEYDMDEVDAAWLTAFNSRLKKNGIVCSRDDFECIMDRIEKEWFEITKDIPRQTLTEESYLEDKCAVCDDDEAENSNAIVFCDGCNMAVHQECYGVPFIPEGQWLCRKCMVCPGRKVTCAVCPSTDGAMKQTTQNQWCHLVCAIWIPECNIQNTIFMEPIEGIESIPKNRWKLCCYICQQKYGAPIQCSTKNCFVAFHPTCARKANLYMNMRGTDASDNSTFRAFCDKHTPKDFQRGSNLQKTLKQAASEIKRQGSESAVQYKLDKRAILSNANSPEKHPTVNNRLVSMQSPIVPQIVLDRVMGDTAHSMQIEEVIAIAKYWCLKKGSLKGAPLLKRLHIEPWTANASANKEDEEMRSLRFEALSAIRRDLVKVKKILELVRKREAEKLLLIRLQCQIFETCLYPLKGLFKYILECCKKFDTHQLFYKPVDVKQVPDYLLYIKSPMDFGTIESKIDANQYRSIDDFQDDINLICSNCLLYNKPETFYAKSATRFQGKANACFDAAKGLLGENSSNLPSIMPKEVFNPENWTFGAAM